mgnify:CR=1 FL=1
MTANKMKWVRLGDYIEQRREKNTFSNLPIRGVTREGFIPPKQLEADTSIYNVFYKNDFVFNPARMELNSIALNTEYEIAICSSLYEVFNISKPSELLPEYLNLYIKRDEFARFCAYDAMGSARNYFRFANLCDIQIPLPPLSVQRDLVEAYEGLKRLAEDNEALIAPLTEACQAFIVDCKRKYQEVQVGEFIEEVDERNKDLSVTLSQGIDVNMAFIPAKREAEDKQNAKIVREDQFAYNKVVKSNGTKLPLALRKGEACFISSSYSVFRIIDEACIIPEFLFLLLSRSEFHRYCGYKAEGTTRDVFSFSELCRVRIPLPPLEIQQSIVRLYHCIEEARSIATEAREGLTKLCPALVQRAIHS